MELAEAVASKSPAATRLSKHTMNTIEDMSLRDGYRYEQDMTAIIRQDGGCAPAWAAFREKRAPCVPGPLSALFLTASSSLFSAVLIYDRPQWSLSHVRVLDLSRILAAPGPARSSPTWAPTSSRSNGPAPATTPAPGVLRS